MVMIDTSKLTREQLEKMFEIVLNKVPEQKIQEQTKVLGIERVHLTGVKSDEVNKKILELRKSGMTINQIFVELKKLGIKATSLSFVSNRITRMKQNGSDVSLVSKTRGFRRKSKINSLPLNVVSHITENFNKLSAEDLRKELKDKFGTVISIATLYKIGKSVLHLKGRKTSIYNVERTNKFVETQILKYKDMASKFCIKNLSSGQKCMRPFRREPGESDRTWAFRKLCSPCWNLVAGGRWKKQVSSVSGYSNNKVRFPILKGVGADLETVKSVLKDVVQGRKEMSFMSYKDVLDIPDLEAWDDFATDVMFNSQDLSSFYGVKNGWSLINNILSFK